MTLRRPGRVIGRRIPDMTSVKGSDLPVDRPSPASVALASGDRHPALNLASTATVPLDEGSGLTSPHQTALRREE